jgi:hypothetical protein
MITFFEKKFRVKILILANNKFQPRQNPEVGGGAQKICAANLL